MHQMLCSCVVGCGPWSPRGVWCVLASETPASHTPLRLFRPRWLPPSKFLPSSGLVASGPDLQLEVWGDVEKSTDGWLQTQVTRRAGDVQGEGLHNGSEEEPQFRPSQAFSQADSLTWQGRTESAVVTSGPTDTGSPQRPWGAGKCLPSWS